MVPKTTNCTKGYTSSKRKLDYISIGNTTKNVARKTILSVHESNNQNKLLYVLLPDGNAAFSAAQGHPEGPVGYMQPALEAY